jgi:hypothetical protein
MEIRGMKVIIDRDIAFLYEVETKRLNEQVKRNKERFPQDFMFRLNKKEKDKLVANCDHLSSLKFFKSNPYAFSGHGVLMLGNILNSTRAIEVSIAVIRAFNKLRRMVSNYEEVLSLLKEYDKKVEDHDKKFIDLYKKVDLIFRDIESRKVGFRLN